MTDLTFTLEDRTAPSAEFIFVWNCEECCNCKYSGDDGLQCPIFQAVHSSWLTRKMPDCVTQSGCTKFEEETQ